MRQHIFLEHLSYDPETGLMKWIKNRKGSIRAGDIAGSIHQKGYIQIGVKGKTYLAHRIALIMSGIDLSAEQQVDHINGDRTDNRLKNLRLATNAQNCQNAFRRKDNNSGFKGVSFDEKRGKWRARIGYEKSQKFLGYFSNAEDAHAAYREASIKLHGEFSKF